jgi:hypothetical protein
LEPFPGGCEWNWVVAADVDGVTGLPVVYDSPSPLRIFFFLYCTARTHSLKRFSRHFIPSPGYYHLPAAAILLWHCYVNV